MTIPRSPEYLRDLVATLRSLPGETSWVEFKDGNDNPEDIGEYVSALSNAAALAGRASAFVVWGIRDQTHELIGTGFEPSSAKKGGEELISWLTRLTSPRLHLHFHEVECGGKQIVILEIPAAPGRPVQFQGVELVRVGSYRQKLKDHPEIERDLWRAFDITPFEKRVVAEHLDGSDVLSLLDFRSYFELIKAPLPKDQDGILQQLEADEMIFENLAGGWDISALGAVLLATDLERFPLLRRKAIRIVVYEGGNRLTTLREFVSREGYGSGFERFIKLLDTLLPRNEVIGQALRADVPMYPELAIRELVANALIHQDFSVTGAGPMLELFNDRMEIVNPGQPLMNTDRLLDTPPRSRNEALASFMRRAGICEERGSGIDKVVIQSEAFQLPAPLFESPDGSTRVVLFAHRSLRDMDRDDRVRACYLHACLRYVQHEPMTNASLRQRFGIEEHNSSIASRIISDAINAGRVKPYDPRQGKKYARYVPWWA